MESNWEKFIRCIWVEALIQAVQIFLYSNLPFLIILIIHYTTSTTENSFISVILLNIKPGEILILVSALLAPFAYVMGSYSRARHHIPGFSILNFFILVLYLSSVTLFVLNRTNVHFNAEVLTRISLGLYLTALVMWYLGIVLQKRLIKIPSDNSSDRADAIAKAL